MKKIFQFTLKTVTLLSILSTISPSASILANTYSKPSTPSHSGTPKPMNPHEKEHLVREVKKNHPTVSEEFIREALEKQLVGDYSIPQEKTMLRSAWQGITVDQMGALIDVGLGALIGAGTGSIAAAIARVGKHEAKRQLKKVLFKYGLVGVVVTDKVLDYVLNLTSPGYHLAKLWDRHDRIKNNGRINF